MDAVEQWTQAQQRVIDLVAPLSTEQANQRVPATPDWTVRELLSHMIGVDVDTVAGTADGDLSDTWTQGHVDSRSDADVAALVAEWRGVTEATQAWMRANDPSPLGDVIIHEQDLRGALGQSGARDSEGLAAIRDTFSGMFDAAVEKTGAGAVELRGESWSHTAGTGEPALVLAGSDFDLTRAIMTRRSESQLQSYVVQGELAPFRDAFAGLGALPGSDLRD